MKRRKILLFVVLILLLSGFFIGWKFLGPATSTPTGEFFYIKTGATFSDVKNDLVEKGHEKYGAEYKLSQIMSKNQNVLVEIMEKIGTK